MFKLFPNYRDKFINVYFTILECKISILDSFLDLLNLCAFLLLFSKYLLQSFVHSLRVLL